MKRMLVLVLLPLVAAAFYLAGSATGVVALAGIGVLLELCFWFALSKGGRRQRGLVWRSHARPY